MNWLTHVETDAEVFQISAGFGKENIATDASHLIFVDKNQFKGCLDSEQLKEHSKDWSPEEIQNELDFFYGQSTQTILDIFSLFVNHQANRLPIIDVDQNLLGVLPLKDLLDLIGEANFISDAADTVIVRKASQDFAYSELIHLLESMNAKLLGSFISDNNTEYVEVYVKIKHRGLNEILQSLRRFDYHIISKHKEDQYKNKLKERSAYLNKYLNI
ncbi:MAG: CBS domain-containing protein [Psychroflexus sp.]|nr:CBS domain-containing protein [Psychroflexus sp.]MDN6309846.1 CBS domain-containing protein [Psychroflexus sp.]